MFMKLTSVLVLIFSFTLTLQASRGSRCLCAASNESTREGANETVTVIERTKYRQLAGVVQDTNGGIMSDVLVEVFDKPEYLLLSYPESEAKKKAQRRVAGCVVGTDGKFCFRGLPPGKYELRFSKAGGWNHTQLYIVIAGAKQKASNRTLEISMKAGT
jgi:hypothetical protein